MTHDEKLEQLRMELARQDRELAECFHELRKLDPELEIAVATEWMSELELDCTVVGAPVAWAVRA